MIDLAVWGPVNDIFRAKFIGIKETQGEDIALQKTSSLLFFLFLGSAIIVLLLELFPWLLSDFLAPHYSISQKGSLDNMIRLVAPILLLNQATLICSSILNSYDSFYIPEISSFITQLFGVVVIIFFSNYIGIYALVFSNYITLIILCFFLFFEIRKKKISLFNNKRPRFSEFLDFFLFCLPLFIPYFLGQLNGTLEKKLINGISVGSLSIIDFSKRIPEILSSLLLSVILIVLVPSLSKAYVQNDMKKFSSDFTASYKLGLFGLGMFVIFMMTGAEDLVNLLYQSKSISQGEISTIVFLNKLYSISIMGVFLYIIFGMSLIATGKSRINAFVGTVAQIVIIGLNFTFVSKYTVIIFPVSMFLGHFVSAIIMSYYYPSNKLELIAVTTKYFITILILSIGLSFLCDLIFDNMIITSHVIRLSVIIFVQIVIVLLVSKLMKIEEVILLTDMIDKKVRNKA